MVVLCDRRGDHGCGARCATAEQGGPASSSLGAVRAVGAVVRLLPQVGGKGISFKELSEKRRGSKLK